MNVASPVIVGSQPPLALIGAPSYTVWETDRAARVVESQLVGAYLDSNGMAVPIASPVPGRRVLHPRAALGPDSSIHVIWGEANDTTPFSPPAQRLLYARLRRGTWSPVETVATGAELAWFATAQSPLKLMGGDLVAAVPEYDASGNRHILTVRRHDGRWIRHRLTLRQSSAAAYLDFAVADGRLVLAYVAAAWDSLNPRGDRNSLLVVTSDDTGRTWSPRTTVHRGGAAGAFDPHAVTGVQGEVYLVWRQDRQDNPDYDSLEMAISVDHGATWRRDPAVPVPGGMGAIQVALDRAGDLHVVFTVRPERQMEHVVRRGGAWQRCRAPAGAAMLGHSLSNAPSGPLLVWRTTRETVGGGETAVAFVAWYGRVNAPQH